MVYGGVRGAQRQVPGGVEARALGGIARDIGQKSKRHRHHSNRKEKEKKLCFGVL